MDFCSGETSDYGPIRPSAADTQMRRSEAHLDKCVSDDLPLLLGICGHIECFANAFPGGPVFLRDWQGCGAVVESVCCVHHWTEKSMSNGLASCNHNELQAQVHCSNTC